MRKQRLLRATIHTLVLAEDEVDTQVKQPTVHLTYVSKTCKRTLNPSLVLALDSFKYFVFFKYILSRFYYQLQMTSTV